jgi:hypothetical protein
MGRQFSYYCVPTDLDEIQARVFEPSGARLFVAEKVSGGERLSPVERFALPLDLMGSAPLFLLAFPPKDMEKVEWDGPWISTRHSHLVEVGRSYVKDKGIRAARFWYETRAFKDGTLVQKPAEFVDWAEALCRSTKRLLVRHQFGQYTSWYGKQAWSQVENEQLEPLLN